MISFSKNKFFLIIGPSGAGKTTIISEILKREPSLTFIPTYTTRKKRASETQGNPYFFISKAKFKNKIQSRDFIEWKKIYEGYYYGLEKKTLIESLKKSSLIKDLDILGAMEVQKKLPNNCISIFIHIKKSDLLDRIQTREKSNQTDPNNPILKSRLKRYVLETLYSSKFDFSIVNSNLENTINSILKIIKGISKITKKKKHKYYLFISNPQFQNKILVIKNKFNQSKYFIPKEDIIENESYKDAIYRKIFLIFYPFSSEANILISKIKLLNSNTLSCEITIPMILAENLKSLETEHFKIKWISKNKIHFNQNKNLH